MKLLTQQGAWRSIARQWKGSNPTSLGYTTPTGELGLCGSIYRLARTKRILKVTQQAMQRRIDEERLRVHGGTYVWPRDDSGKAKRIEFCLRMARQLNRKGRA